MFSHYTNIKPLEDLKYRLIG